MSFLSFSVICLYVLFGIVIGKYCWHAVIQLAKKRINRLHTCNNYPQIHKDVILRIYLIFGISITVLLLQGMVLLMEQLV